VKWSDTRLPNQATAGARDAVAAARGARSLKRDSGSRRNGRVSGPDEQRVCGVANVSFT